MSVRLVFFNDTATTEIYTLSLHDALPISAVRIRFGGEEHSGCLPANASLPPPTPVEVAEVDFEISEVEGGYILDRKSTRLNSSHANISYAVFCLKKNTSRYSVLVRLVDNL